MKSRKPSSTRAKRVVAEVETVMRRAPDGSAFLTCDSCKTKVPVATADMHACADDAAFKANLARLQEDHRMRMQQAVQEKEAKAAAKKESKRSSSSTAGGGSSRSSKGKDKDPDAPKKPQSAYFVFLEEFRESFKAGNPDVKMSVTEMTKEASAKWNSMSEEEKEPYKKESDARKEKYEKELAEYLSNKDKAAATGADDIEEEGKESEPKEEAEAAATAAGAAGQEKDATTTQGDSNQMKQLQSWTKAVAAKAADTDAKGDVSGGNVKADDASANQTPAERSVASAQPTAATAKDECGEAEGAGGGEGDVAAAGADEVEESAATRPEKRRRLRQVKDDSDDDVDGRKNKEDAAADAAGLEDEDA